MDPKPSSLLKRSRAPSIHVDTSAVNQQRETHPGPNSADHDGSKLAAPTSWAHGGNSSPSSHSPSDTLRPSTDAPLPKYVRAPSRSSLEEILRPTPADADLFRVDQNPFAFTPGHLSRLLNPKNIRLFLALGGLAGIEKGLRTDAKAGLSVDETDLTGEVSFQDATGSESPSTSEPSTDGPAKPDHDHGHGHHHKAGESFTDRKRVFGMNSLPEIKSKSFLQLVWIALQDKVLILLSVAAVVSLALGLYQTFGIKEHEGARIEWVEGVAIIVAIAVVSLVGALNDWQKERQFQKLNRKKEDRLVKVVRSGKPCSISIEELLVGDLLMLEQGDVIPVDGLFVDGHNVSCDESSATGESDLIKKTPAEAVVRTVERPDATDSELRKLDPFIVSGSKVLDGVGTCLVTAVGPYSSHGRTMLALRDDNELTPLQLKLNLLAGYIAKMGSAAGLLLFTVLTIEFLVGLRNNTDTPDEKGQNFIKILITSITIIVVAVPEGLPLAVTLALAFATKKMTKENNLVRHLQSCETMGNATVICSDKTGTLTENVMTVVAGSIGGGSVCFGDESTLEQLRTVSPTDGDDEAAAEEAKLAAARRNLVQPGEISAALHADVRDLLNQSIGINSTAFEATSDNGALVFVGTKTETALLDWARANFGMEKVEVSRANNPVTEMYPFNSSRKCMSAVIRLPGTKKYRVFVKGAPEVLLAQCHKVLDAPGKGLHASALDNTHQAVILEDVSKFAGLSLRTLGLCFRDCDQWPPARRAAGGDPNVVEFSDVFREMTWIGAVGIQDPVRKNVPGAVNDCRRAFVGVKMVTGDNIKTATAIARACGLLEDGGRVMEGVEFRRMTEAERGAVVGDLRVLARSSPEDKRVLVRALQAQGEVVAVTGDGTNDAPALKAADVGFSMGITGTEVAKEASDIILLDDNFSSIVKALAWGRAINDAVKKFLQFQITVNITAVMLTFVTAVSSDKETSVLTAVQLLWVNLIMDTFAALALATDPPTASLLDRRPEGKTAPLITLTMWKMIIGQSIYQLTVCFVLHYGGPSFLAYPADEMKALVFNTFVFMQIFKLLNSRRIDNKLNILEGLTKNHLFFLMAFIMVAGQVLIMFVGGPAFSITRINPAQWGISLVLGFMSIPVGILVRLFPDAWLRACIPNYFRERAAKKAARRRPREDYDLTMAMMDIREDLALFNKIRGGRMAFLCDPAYIQAQLQGAKRRRRGSSASGSRMIGAVGMSGLIAASIGGLPSPERPRSAVSNGEGVRDGERGRGREREGEGDQGPTAQGVSTQEVEEDAKRQGV